MQKKKMPTLPCVGCQVTKIKIPRVGLKKFISLTRKRNLSPWIPSCSVMLVFWWNLWQNCTLVKIWVFQLILSSLRVLELYCGDRKRFLKKNWKAKAFSTHKRSKKICSFYVKFAGGTVRELHTKDVTLFDSSQGTRGIFSPFAAKTYRYSPLNLKR